MIDQDEQTDRIKVVLIGGKSDGKRLLVPNRLQEIKLALPPDPIGTWRIEDYANSKIADFRYETYQRHVLFAGRDNTFVVYAHESLDGVSIMERLIDGYKNSVKD